MSKKIILIILIIVIVLGFVVYRFFFKEEKPEFVLAKVVRGTVLKEVSETGTVRVSEETNLSFKNSGRIEKIYVEVGDKIEPGQRLAELDTSQLFIELTESQAALEVAQADYNKLLAGASKEEIKVAEAKVLNAQVALDNAEQKLKDVEIDAEEDLKNVYEDALNTLDDAYLKIYNAHNVTKEIQRSYFTSNDQESIKVKDNKDRIEKALNQAGSYINEAKSDSQNEKIDIAILKVKESLKNTRDALEIIRDMTEQSTYRESVSSSDKTSLDNQKSYVISVLTDLINAQQTISTTKITNETNINSAKAEISTAKAELEKAKDELALKKAGPGQEDIDLYLAKIKQAKSQVSLLENKIQETTLKTPSAGQITKVNKKEGEMVQSADSVVAFLPSGPFQVEVDIYEEDIVYVRENNPVKITLAAFPDEVLKGRILSIEPAEKLIEGVVYYEVTIDFEEEKTGIKPGMTADIIIETQKKENVLVIPKEALKKRNAKKIVQVPRADQIEEREIEIGLEGDELIEVISGLSEGEQIIID